MNSIKETLLRCSFCGKTQEEVKKIIAGPTVYICDECIDLCNEIMEEEYQNEHPEQFQQELLKPSEIKEVLDKYVVGQEKSKKVLAHHTGRKIEQIAEDTQRDFYFSSQEAKEYGIIDEVMQNRKLKAV